MRTATASPALLAQVSGVISEQLGLFFPPERSADLERRLSGAAQTLGFGDLAACLEWLAVTPFSDETRDTLAAALTIGETYFYRDPAVFDALQRQLIPPLLEARRQGDRRLRIWSAGCSSGEEPYSIAIALTRAVPDLADWHVTLLATDLNPRALAKAEAGEYGNWSFRGAPSWLREQYFRCLGEGRWAVRDEIKRMVTFAPLNLVEDRYPSLVTNTSAIDILFCRNVLMYFHLDLIARVVGRFSRALLEGGWLIVSPSELSPVVCGPFRSATIAGAIVLRNGGEVPAPAFPAWSVPPAPPPVPPVGFTWPVPLPSALTPGPTSIVPPVDLAPVADRVDALAPAAASEAAGVDADVPSSAADAAYERAEQLYADGSYAEAASALQTVLAAAAADSVTASAGALLARTYANLGELDAAEAWCERAIVAEKGNAALHYLLATILVERDRWHDAERALRRTLYLEPNFVLAHFTLGTVIRRHDGARRAEKCFANTLALLRDYAQDDPLPSGDGMTAGRLAEIAAAMAQR